VARLPKEPDNRRSSWPTCDHDFEAERERPIRLQVVAGPRFEPATWSHSSTGREGDSKSRFGPPNPGSAISEWCLIKGLAGRLEQGFYSERPFNTQNSSGQKAIVLDGISVR